VKAGAPGSWAAAGTTALKSPAAGLKPGPAESLDAVRYDIVRCERCPRLRRYCTEVARVRKAAHRHETYWGRPVPGFGDPRARVLIVGLAPAAHGANRTGRVFTGDGVGGSGDFLMRALHDTGFASIPTSRRPDDGLELRDAYILATVRCAPPDNKPLPSEIRSCEVHLDREWLALPGVRLVVALGRIAFDACWAHLARRGIVVRPRPPFEHGAAYRAPGGPLVIASYHPSRQNTNTGRLTPEMLVSVFAAAREALAGHEATPLRVQPAAAPMRSDALGSRRCQ
jgi:uracil-DNA glycosylase